MEKKMLADQLYAQGRLSPDEHQRIVSDISTHMGGLPKTRVFQSGKWVIPAVAGGIVGYAVGRETAKRKYMAYTPTYVASDLPLIGADAIGTAGAAVVPLIPLGVTAGALYVGAKGAKKAFKKGKKRKYKADKWLGEVPKKDDFGAPITDEFIDGKTAMGPWGIMSPRTFRQMGTGLGMGKGQRYKKNPQGEWEKVEG
jgi:hypothetical protein